MLKIGVGVLLVLVGVLGSVGMIVRGSMEAEPPLAAAILVTVLYQCAVTAPGVFLIRSGLRARRMASVRQHLVSTGEAGPAEPGQVARELGVEEAVAEEAIRDVQVVCTECGSRFRQIAKRSFGLGFPTFSCPHCKQDFAYPLTDGYRVAYWIFAVLLGYAALSIPGQMAEGKGGVPIVGIPGIIGIIGIIALVKDRGIRAKVQAALGKSQSDSQPASPDPAAARLARGEGAEQPQAPAGASQLQAERYDPLVWGALVLSILPIIGMASVPMAIVSLRRIHRSGGALRGSALAWFALAVSGAWAACYLYAALVTIGV